MPYRAPRPCAHVSCDNLSTQTYCQIHAADARPWAVERRKTPGKLDYHTAAWQRKREWRLKRDHYLCQVCLKKQPPIFSAAYGVDHVIPVSEGGTDDEENLQAICRECHSLKTQKESMEARKCLTT